MYYRLKDICSAMDDCHPRTAKRWWKKLDAQCRRAGLPGVAPDVLGHGAHKWTARTFQRLIDLWRTYYATRGTTPALAREKFVRGIPASNPQQPELNFNESNKPSPSRRIFTATMAKTDTTTKARGIQKAGKARFEKNHRRRAAAAR